MPVVTTKEESIQSKGGKARRDKLTPEQRSENARKAALQRWGTRDEQNEGDSSETSAYPTAEYTGTLKIGNITFDCANLDDGTRVLSENSVARVVGRSIGGKTRRLAASHNWDERPMPVFISSRPLEPFVPASLRLALSEPKWYKTKNGTIRAGVEAALLSEICGVWVKASQMGVLQKSQEHIAERARILLQGLANVGIQSLVDAATGFEKVRDKLELSRILENYISSELLPWTRHFPEEFYKQMFRLYGWQYNPLSVKRPKLVGKLTEELIYKQLPDGVLDRLREKNPILESGYRKNKHFQFLTDDVGDEHLKKQMRYRQ
jgi:hypothetical protein